MSVFDDKEKQPAYGHLIEVLAESAPLFTAIEEYIEQEYGEKSREWKFYSRKAGWTLSIFQKKRRIIGVVPFEGSFAVGFVFGRRAVEAARESDIPKDIMALIEEAREYVEGRAFRFDVKTTDDVETVKKLITIKVAN